MNKLYSRFGSANRLRYASARLACGAALSFGLISANAQILQYATSWIGNSSGLGNDTNGNGGKWIQQDTQGIAVGADGTVWSVCPWDEGGHEVSAYQNGALAGFCGDLHGWGRVGSDTIAINDSYVFVAVSQGGCDGGDYPKVNANGLYNYPPCGTTWYCVRRYNRSTYQPAKFTAGYGWDGSFLLINSATNGDASVRGLAANNSSLYVSDPWNGRIRVFSTTTMAQTAQWAVNAPGKLALDGTGRLWVLQAASGTNAASVSCYTTNGVLQRFGIAFAPNVKPSAMAFNAALGQIMIADAGPDLNIKFYSTNVLPNSTAIPVSTLGAVYGYLSDQGAPRGMLGPLRFNLPAGVGADAAGNVYVGQDGSVADGGAVIESYKGTNRNWVVYGLEFVNCADFDPGDPSQIYTTEDHDTFDYWQPVMGKQWSCRANTVDRDAFPQDARLHIDPASVFVRSISGHRFLFMTGQYGGWLSIYRFDTNRFGEIAVPCGFLSTSHITGHNNDTNWPPYQPASGEWLWLDSNTNGAYEAAEFRRKNTNPGSDWNGGWALWVDSRGSIWQGGSSGSGFIVRVLRCGGVDSKGVPIYSYANSASCSTPPGVTWNDLCRIVYVPASDTMYLAGFTTALTNKTDWWGLVGRGVYRYDSWSAKPVLHTGYPIELPNDPQAQDSIKAMAIAGDYLFAIQTRAATVHVYNVTNGATVGMIVPGPEVNGTSGWVDTAYGINAVRRASGEYAIIAEEDSYAKNLVYLWCPDGNCSQVSIEQLAPQGVLHGGLSGAPHSTFWIESSTNLVQWQAVTSVTNPTGAVGFVATNASTEFQFYRAHLRSKP